MKNKRGWFAQPNRHALASRGVKTTTSDLFKIRPDEYEEFPSKKFEGERVRKIANLDDKKWDNVDVWISDNLSSEKKKDIISSLFIVESSLTLGETDFVDEIVFLEKDDDLFYGYDNKIVINSSDTLSTSKLVYGILHETGHSFLRKISDRGGQFHILLDRFIESVKEGEPLTIYTEKIDEDETLYYQETFAELNAIFRDMWKNKHPDEMSDRQREVYEKNRNAYWRWKKIKQFHKEVVEYEW